MSYEFSGGIAQVTKPYVPEDRYRLVLAVSNEMNRLFGGSNLERTVLSAVLAVYSQNTGG